MQCVDIVGGGGAKGLAEAGGEIAWVAESDSIGDIGHTVVAVGVHHLPSRCEAYMANEYRVTNAGECLEIIE